MAKATAPVRPRMTPTLTRFNTPLLAELRDLAAHKGLSLGETIREAARGLVAEADREYGAEWRSPERQYRHGWYDA